MTQTFYSYMAIPKKCLLQNVVIFKKSFKGRGCLSTTDKKILESDISKIRWAYTLKPHTINISAYCDDVRKYEEIVIIEIILTSKKHTQHIASFVNKAIPYPIVLVFSFEDTIAISVADKRINLSDVKNKWVVENIWMTEWFNPDDPNEIQKQFMKDMAVNNLSFVNFYAMYTDMKIRVIALMAATQNGRYQILSAEKTEVRCENLVKIKELERKIVELRHAIKKEKRFNKQVELNVFIKEQEKILKGIKENL